MVSSRLDKKQSENNFKNHIWWNYIFLCNIIIMQKRFEDMTEIERRNLYDKRLFSIDDQKKKSSDNFSNITTETVNIDKYITNIQRLASLIQLMDDNIISESGSILLSIASDLVLQVAKLNKMSKIMVEQKLPLLTRSDISKIIKETQNIKTQTDLFIENNAEYIIPEFQFKPDIEKFIPDIILNSLENLMNRLVRMLFELAEYFKIFRKREQMIGKGFLQIPRKYM